MSALSVLVDRARARADRSKAARARAAPAALALLLALTLSTSSRADDDPAVGLRMQTNTTTVKVGETFQVDVILTVRGQDSVDSLEGPDTTDFTLLNESESQKASFFAKNGRRSVVVEHRRALLLRADEAGDFEVGEAIAKLGDASARAAPLKIRVLGDKKKNNDGKGFDDDDANDEGNAKDDAGRDVDDADKDAEKGADDDSGPGARFHGAPPPVFLEVTPDKDTAYVGEQIGVVVEVWSQMPLGSYPRVPGLKPAGFVCLPLDDGTRLTATQRSLNGKNFYVYPVSRDALFALTPGKKQLPVLSIEVSPAGSFFSRGQDVRVTSPPVSIDVKPLPPYDGPGAPDAFVSGNVGAFRLSVTTRPSSVKVGEPFTLVVEASGHGNIDAVTLPVWSGDSSVRLFPPTERRERRDKDGVVAGRVVQEILVQPQEAKDVVVPALSLVSFWPGEAKYLTSSSQPLTVRVQGAAATKSAAKKQQTLSGNGPRPLHLDAAASDDVVSDRVVAVSGAAAAAAVVASFFLSLRRRKQQSAGAVRAAGFAARKRALDDAADLATLHRLLLDALADRAGDDIRATPHGALPLLLTQRGVDDATAQAARDALSAAEAARYAPGAAPRKLKDDIVAVVARLDRADSGAPARRGAP